MAEKAEIDKRTLQRIESGKTTKPAAKTIERLKVALGIEIGPSKRRSGTHKEIQDPELRRWLECARALLDDPEFVLLDDAGQVVPVRESGDRLILAATLAYRAWEACNANVLSRTMARVSDPDLRAREYERQVNLLGLTLGVGPVALERFRKVHLAGLTSNRLGSWCIRFEGDASPSQDDARFAVDFATDWVLKVQRLG